MIELILVLWTAIIIITTLIFCVAAILIGINYIRKA